MSSTGSRRAPELDFFRGVAMLFVILMHLTYDLRYVFGVDAFETLEARWFYPFFQSIFLCIFAGVSGICCVFSRNNVKRGLKLGFFAILLTVATYIATYKFNIDCLILYNVLHLLSTCILIYALIEFVERKLSLDAHRVNLFLALIAAYICVAGSSISNFHNAYSSWFFIPFGIRVKDMPGMADWLPFFPWAGVFFIGTIIGRNEYKDKKSLFEGVKWLNSKAVRCFAVPFEFLGKHSLIIYAVHQPIFLGVLYLVFR